MSLDEDNFSLFGNDMIQVFPMMYLLHLIIYISHTSHKYYDGVDEIYSQFVTIML